MRLPARIWWQYIRGFVMLIPSQDNHVSHRARMWLVILYHDSANSLAITQWLVSILVEPFVRLVVHYFRTWVSSHTIDTLPRCLFSCCLFVLLFPSSVQFVRRPVCVSWPCDLYTTSCMAAYSCAVTVYSPCLCGPNHASHSLQLDQHQSIWGIIIFITSHVHSKPTSSLSIGTSIDAFLDPQLPSSSFIIIIITIIFIIVVIIIIIFIIIIIVTTIILCASSVYLVHLCLACHSLRHYHHYHYSFLSYVRCIHHFATHIPIPSLLPPTILDRCSSWPFPLSLVLSSSSSSRSGQPPIFQYSYARTTNETPILRHVASWYCKQLNITSLANWLRNKHLLFLHQLPCISIYCF